MTRHLLLGFLIVVTPLLGQQAASPNDAGSSAVHSSGIAQSPQKPQHPRKDVATIAKETKGAVVSIVMADKSGQPIAQGSGFVVSRDGKVVTNYHVIKSGSSAIIKLPDGSFFTVDGVLAFDKNRDIAIIKAHGSNFKTVPLGDSDRLQIGDDVVAIGSPLSLESTVSNGIVSGIRTEKKDAFDEIDPQGGQKILQITAPISHGSSGGPLFNMAGLVVGITSAALIGGENLNFAVPINDVKPRLTGISSVRPFPDETEEADNAPSPTVAEPKLTYSQHVDREGKSHYSFHADCSAVGNVESCLIFNELAGNDESELFRGLVAYDESLVCFASPESRDNPHYRAKLFSVFSLSTHVAKDPDDLDTYSMITYYNNGVLSNYVRLFYLVPSALDDSYVVMETGQDDEPLQGSLSKEEFSYHQLFQNGRFEDWNYNSYEASLLTGRMTERVSGSALFGRCFSFTRPQWAQEKTEDEKTKERQQYAAKVAAKVKAREDAAKAEAKKENDCVINSYRPYCASCSEKQLQDLVFNSLVAHDDRFVSIANKCKAQLESQAKQEKEVATVKSLNEKLSAAKTAADTGDYDTAIGILNEANQFDPSRDLIWFKLGEYYRLSVPKQPNPAEKQKRLDAAVEAYQKAVQIKQSTVNDKDPNAAKVLAAYYNNLGEAYAKSNKVDDAIKSYARAAQIYPSEAVQYYFNTGAVLTNAGRMDDAIAAFDKVIASDPNKADAYYWKAVNMIAKANLQGDNFLAPPGTADALQRYLKLQPSGIYAEEAKQRLASIGASVETSIGEDQKPKQ